MSARRNAPPAKKGPVQVLLGGSFSSPAFRGSLSHLSGFLMSFLASLFGQYDGILFFDCHGVLDQPKVSSVIQAWRKDHPRIYLAMLSFVGAGNGELQAAAFGIAKQNGLLPIVVFDRAHKTSVMNILLDVIKKSVPSGKTFHLHGLVDDHMMCLRPAIKKGIPSMLCSVAAPHYDDMMEAKSLSGTPGFLFVGPQDSLSTALDLMVKR